MCTGENNFQSNEENLFLLWWIAVIVRRLFKHDQATELVFGGKWESFYFKVTVIGWEVCQQRLMATSDHCLFLLNLWRSSGGSVRGLPFLLWALDRQVTFVSPSLCLLAPDGGRVSSFPFQGQDAASTVKKCWALCPQIGCDMTCWFRELGGWSKGSCFQFIFWILRPFSASLFQENLLQDLSSSGCLTMRELPMPCVLGWESLAATLS